MSEHLIRISYDFGEPNGPSTYITQVPVRYEGKAAVIAIRDAIDEAAQAMKDGMARDLTAKPRL